MQGINVLRPACGLAVVALLSFGAVQKVCAQMWDPSEGSYLTEEEYKRLSKDEALEYCEKLAQEIDIQNDNAAAANRMLSDIDAEISRLREQVSRSRMANDPLAREVADLEAKLRQLQELPRSYTVVPGDFLIKISGMPRIYGDETHWKRIFRANRNDIKDPNLIYPDQVFLIPRGTPTQHVVVQGEWLALIAGYKEVYGDRREWPRLYEANRSVIGADPSILAPGTVLNIPR
jgi:nucleoid-associated protein YgaU